MRARNNHRATTERHRDDNDNSLAVGRQLSLVNRHLLGVDVLRDLLKTLADGRHGEVGWVERQVSWRPKKDIDVYLLQCYWLALTALPACQQLRWLWWPSRPDRHGCGDRRCDWPRRPDGLEIFCSPLPPLLWVDRHFCPSSLASIPVVE